MTALAFLDTNILCYTKDSTDPIKHRKSQELIEHLFENKTARISTQVINEYYVFLKRAARDEGEKISARISAQSLTRLAPIAISHDLQFKAWSYEERFQISWWDALIIAAAHEARCQIIYTEDLQHQQKFNELTVVNPFI